MQIQSNLGSTIAMAFDECAPAKAERDYVEKSVARTTRWLARCKKEMQRLNSLPDTVNPNQLLFGINQGAVYADIRIDHAKRISELDLPGYAVGGLAVGETHEEMYHVLDETVPYLPQDKPTYLMGVGTPANILEAVDRGLTSLIVYIRPETEDTGMCIQSLVKSIFLTHSTKRMTDRLKKAVSVRSVKTIREHMYAIF